MKNMLHDRDASDYLHFLDDIGNVHVMKKGDIIKAKPGMFGVLEDGDLEIYAKKDRCLLGNGYKGMPVHLGSVLFDYEPYYYQCRTNTSIRYTDVNDFLQKLKVSEDKYLLFYFRTIYNIINGLSDIYNTRLSGSKAEAVLNLSRQYKNTGYSNCSLSTYIKKRTNISHGHIHRLLSKIEYKSNV